MTDFRTKVESESDGRVWRLAAKEARPLQSGLLSVKELKVESEGDHRAPSLVVTAPECQFDQQSGQERVYSTNRLELNSGQGNFVLKGAGFNWLLSEGSLTLSNQVVAEIRKELLNTEGSEGAGVITITSSRFVYREDVAVFLDNVRAVDSQGGTLSCETLTANLAESKKGIEHIRAEGGVRFVRDEITARGREADFDLAANDILLKGPTEWTLEDKIGRSDQLRLDQTTGEAWALGNVNLKFPDVGFLTEAAGRLADRASGGPQPGEISSQELHYSRQREAVFTGGVVANAGEAFLKSETLTVEGSEADQPPKRATAKGAVEIRQADTKITGEEAVFDGEAQTVTLTGGVQWQSADQQGKSERGVFHLEKEYLLAEGEVVVEIEGRGMADADKAPKALQRLRASGGTNDVVVVNSDVMESSGLVTLFRGDVKVTLSGGHLTCTTLTVEQGEGGDLVKVTAEGDVRFNRGDQLFTGQTAVYEVAKGVIEVTGDPRFITPGRVVRADVWIYDVQTDTVRARGNWRVEAESEGEAPVAIPDLINRLQERKEE